MGLAETTALHEGRCQSIATQGPIDNLKKLPVSGSRTAGYGQGMATASEKLLADNPPESLRTFAALSLMEGLHHQAAVENNAEVEPKLAEAAQKYSTDADKKVAAQAQFYIVEAKGVKSDDVDVAQLPALLTELKAALKGNAPTRNSNAWRTRPRSRSIVWTTKNCVTKNSRNLASFSPPAPTRSLQAYGNDMKSLKLIAVAKPELPMGGPDTDWTGKPMVIAGRTADGKQFDITAYKGKVVLSIFGPLGVVRAKLDSPR